MNNKFDSPRESCSLDFWRQSAALSWGKLTKSLAQSVTRRGALKKFGAGIAGMALTCFGLANKAEAVPQWCDPNAGGCCCKGCKTYLPHDHPNYIYCKSICSSGFGCGPGKPQFP